MERQKREENTIIIHFAFYFVLTIWLLAYLFLSILPQLLSIEDTKKSTKEVYTDLTRIEKSWLTFDEFKSLNNVWSNTVVVNEILKGMTWDFFTNNLVNTKYNTYKEFLDKNTADLNSNENKKLSQEKIDRISRVLPPYTDNSIDFSNYALTDYKFVNYVESIIESFNFNTSNSIWISKLSLLDDYAISTWNGWDALEANIYYIPLNLVLQWTKSSVIEFLYFIENVGNISVDKNNININNNYWFLSKNWVKKVLEWDKLTSSYNIFEHQIIDIDKITFNDYIDSSYLSRGDTNFKDFIIKTQWNDKYEINLNLLFYVKWQPSYKLVEQINSILDKYKETQGKISKLLGNTKTEWLDRISLTKYNDTIKQFSEETNNMRKSLVKKENLEEIYIRALKIDEIINPIFKSLKK